MNKIGEQMNEGTHTEVNKYKTNKTEISVLMN